MKYKTKGIDQDQKMSYPSLYPKPLTEETRQLTEHICDEGEMSRYDKVHFGFNGAPPELGNGTVGRIRLHPDKQITRM